MRVVHYISRMFTRRDAVVEVAIGWTRALSSIGVDVALLHGTPDVLEGPPGLDCDVEYVPHAGVDRNLVPLSLGRHLRAGDVLVLHTDWRMANYVAAAAARRKGVPYLVVPHGEYYPQKVEQVDTFGAVRTRLERELVRRALGVHLFWPSEEAPVRPFIGSARCIVAPTGFDVVPGAWKGGGGYWSWLGRYVMDHKGLDVLAEAMALVPVAERPRIELRGFDIQGDQARLDALVARLGVGDDLVVGGPVLGDDKERFLVEADAYVHPSRWECHSIALLENLSRGIPCLVTDGNHAAPALAGAGAAVVAAGSPAGLAEGIERMAAADRAELGERGAAFVRDRLDWARTAEDFMDQVRAALG